MNRQCAGAKLKYIPKFCIGVTGHVISRMRSDDLHWTGTLESNISKKAGDRGLVHRRGHKFSPDWGDSQVVSISDFEARGTGFESRWGQRNSVMELVNIYHVLSCLFV